MVKKKETRLKIKKNVSNGGSNKKTTGNIIKTEIFSIIVFMLAVFLLVSIKNFQNIPDDTKFIGIIGAYLSRGVQILCGHAAMLAPIYLLAWSIHMGVYRKYWSARMWGVTLLFLISLAYVSIYRIPLGLNAWEASLRGLGGGYIGGGIAFMLIRLLGKAGTSIFLTLCVLLSLIMIFNKSLSEMAALLWINIKKIGAKLSKIMFYEEIPAAAFEAESKEAVIINPVSIDPESEELAPAKKNMIEPQMKEQKQEKKKSNPQIEMVYRDNGDINHYVKPSYEMLSIVESDRTIDKKNIKDSIAILEDTFASFGVSVKVNQVSCGPAVIRYELTPAPGVKVSKIISLSDDLQLNLAAKGIRIEAPIPGKSAIGIEVPSSKVSSVGLRNLLTASAFKKLNSPLSFALGEDVSGNPVVAKLSDMPHLLIAGSTGSGKSVCLNSIIMCLLYNATPDELKLVFIDPKMVELTVYNGIPHLMTPVVTDAKKASMVLRWMTTEMEKRYKLFAEMGVRDIYRYNQSASPLPFIVIIIDELADLMMVAPVEVEDSICRLAQMARAAGIHLIVATQRPSVDVVTGIIKANIPSRIAFAVSSQTDSRTILDIGGAEKLLGKGDMLFSPVGAVKPFRVQGAFVSDHDIEITVNYIKGQVLSEPAVDQLAGLESSLENMDLDYEDEVFWDAVKILVENQKSSVSFLQRKLRIGYSRAARLMDLMEERGIVSEIDVNKKREILISMEQMEKLYANNKNVLL
ncbi:MAG: DNA translocase FtsK 4TM domain-containing protein [Syntrophomonas sp.]|nr:DNA translocase FtsK 4TM domain-containing protein [Syntrophomonas sp.]